MTNRKCKIFSIFLALTLVLASVGVAFADDDVLYSPSDYFWLYDRSSSVVTLTRIDEFSIRYRGNGSLGMCYAGVSGDINDLGHSKSVYAEFTVSAPNSPVYFGNTTLSAGYLTQPVVTDENRFIPISGCESIYLTNSYTYNRLDYPTLKVEDGGKFGMYLESYNGFGEQNAMMAFRPQSTSTDIYSTLTLSRLEIGGVTYFIDGEQVMPEPPAPPETYSFTVPYGSDLKITGQDIQTVLVRASTIKRGTLGNYLQKFNLSDIRYSASSDFEKSIPVPLSGTGKTSLTGGYSEFAGYCVPSNSFTIYNRVGNSNNISVDVYVNVTGRNVKGVYYSPQSNQDILDGVSSPTSENGDFAVTGGSGTPDDPYVTNPVNDDGVPISYDSLTPVIDNSPSDGVQNELLNRLDSIFAIPSRVASSVSGWIAGLAQLTTALYSAFPPVITDLFVAFFSIVVLIGLVKMFL